MTPGTGDPLAPAELERLLRAAIRDVRDFPNPGVVFKDITPVLEDARLFRRTTDAMAAPFEGLGVTHVLAIESRGFILGAPVAQHLLAAFVPVRKQGRLPGPVSRRQYALEYGLDALEMHRSALRGGDRVLIVDDVLATGGTASAACGLAEELGGTVVGCSFLMELSFLPGAQALAGREVERLLVY